MYTNSVVTQGHRASAPDLLKPIHHAREYEAEMRARQAAANEQDDSVVSAHSVTDLETSKHINFAHLTVALFLRCLIHTELAHTRPEDVTRVSLVLGTGRYETRPILRPRLLPNTVAALQ